MADFEAVREYGRQHLGWDKETPVNRHVSQARVHIELAKQVVDSTGASIHLGIAKAEATLALVEQVRLSNLIQWAALTNNTKGHAAAITEGLDL